MEKNLEPADNKMQHFDCKAIECTTSYTSWSYFNQSNEWVVLKQSR